MIIVSKKFYDNIRKKYLLNDSSSNQNETNSSNFSNESNEKNISSSENVESKIQFVDSEDLKNILAENLICFEAHLTKSHLEIISQNKLNIEALKTYLENTSIVVEDELDINNKKKRGGKYRPNNTNL